VGTEKRERQKLNRELGRQVQAKQEQKAATKKKAIQVGAAIGAAVLLALVFWLIGRAKGDDTPTDTTVAGTDTTVSGEATTTAASEAAKATVPGVTLDAAPECVTIPDEGGPVETATERVTSFTGPMSVDCIDTSATYLAQVSTNRGDYTITLDPSKAPQTVASFIGLAANRFYENTTCHRVVKDFVVQCGSLDGSGTDGPGYTIADELPTASSEYVTYSVAMAHSSLPDSNGSQFFITTNESAADILGTGYSLFGTVTTGTEAIDNMNSLGEPDETPSGLIQITGITVTKAA
jgi:peptidyl-prolyl cis-trans isomerase B (cyclophilin B)